MGLADACLEGCEVISPTYELLNEIVSSKCDGNFCFSKRDVFLKFTDGDLPSLHSHSRHNGKANVSEAEVGADLLNHLSQSKLKIHLIYLTFHELC